MKLSVVALQRCLLEITMFKIIKLILCIPMSEAFAAKLSLENVAGIGKQDHASDITNFKHVLT